MLLCFMHRILPIILLLCASVANAQHIVRSDADSVIVATGSTYKFSVDTHEDSGLVSTATTVQDILREIRGLLMKVTDSSGKEKKEGILVTGDRLFSGDFSTPIGV